MPPNVERIEHLAPRDHAAFYAAQRFTLNVTRADMVRAGFSPSVRLFEAAACGTPVVSDAWPGIETIFAPGEEILLARTAEDALAFVAEMPDERRRSIGERARRRVLAEHTAAHRAVAPRWDLGYVGTYGADRQPALERLLVEPARRRRDLRFVVAGPQYPRDIRWPPNVARMEHLAPPQHVSFYNAQRFSLNATRRDMVRAGWSPSVRLFEAAACATPIVSDAWEGLEAFFTPGEEILLAGSTEEALTLVRDLGDGERRRVGEAARARVLREHTAAHRAEALERYVEEARRARRRGGLT